MDKCINCEELETDLEDANREIEHLKAMLGEVNRMTRQ